MVNIPIRLIPAVKRKGISFNQLERGTLSRIRYRKVSEATGEEVEAHDIVKGYDLGGDNYVVVDDDDLAPLAPAKSKEIGLETFVPAADISPLMFDSSYIVLPNKTAKPYALLAKALAGSDRVGIGKFVMRQKEYLAVIRSDGEHLTLSTLVFPDEMVGIDSVEEFEELEGIGVSDRELMMARSLVEALSEEFEPTAYVDEYRQAVERIIADKAAGRAITVAEAPARKAAVIDLASALEASLRDAQAARVRHPTSKAKKPASATTDVGARAKHGRAKTAPKKVASPRVRKSA